MHIDGKYAGGHLKQKNRPEDRIDRRKKKYQNLKRMTILAMREKTLFGRGRERTLTRVIRTEDSNEAWEFARRSLVVDPHNCAVFPFRNEQSVGRNSRDRAGRACHAYQARQGKAHHSHRRTISQAASSYTRWPTAWTTHLTSSMMN
ncbi:transposase [Rhizobium sp. CF122]|uniref:transposase n=1 Tax=Rhizobium sp. CF122 TaxID=1144312 RepID=UPI003FD277F2